MPASRFQYSEIEEYVLMCGGFLVFGGTRQGKCHVRCTQLQCEGKECRLSISGLQLPTTTERTERKGLACGCVLRALRVR